MSTSAASAKQNHLFWLLAGLASVVYLGSATWQVFFGALNTDEGFYAVATRAVAQGEMPYRDFGFTQPPLVLYANCLPLRIAGFGLFPQRAVNGLWAALALLLAAGWLAHRTQRGWGVALIVGFSLSAPWMYFVHLGKTYGVATLFVLLAALAFLAMRVGPRRNFTLGVLTALGIGTRLPAAPFFAVLWLLALWPDRRPQFRECLAAAGGLLLGLVPIVPFWLAAPEAMKFWVVDFHRLSVPARDWTVSGVDIMTLAPAVWLLALLAGGIIAVRRRFFTRETGVMLAALVALAANLLPTGAYVEYGAPFLLPLATTASAFVFDEWKARKRSAVVALAVTLAAAHGLTGPLLSHEPQFSRTGLLSEWLPGSVPAYRLALPSDLATARRVVEQSLAPGAPFVGSNIILAAEMGRAVPRNLRMGPFSFTVEIPADRAERLHLATHEELDSYFARPDITLLAFFKRRELNYGWSMPSFDQLREDFHSQWFAPLRRDFTTACDSEDFVVLVRKNPP